MNKTALREKINYRFDNLMSHRNGEVLLNPAMDTEIAFSESDRLIVLSEQ